MTVDLVVTYSVSVTLTEEDLKEWNDKESAAVAKFHDDEQMYLRSATRTVEVA